MNRVLGDMAYHVMLCFPDNQRPLEKIADEGNLVLLENDWWLADTAVIDTINYAKDSRKVYLTFTNYKKLLQLIVRRITSCYCGGKARAVAHCMRRLTVNEQLGTLTLKLKDLNLCIN